jgi:hypothetical protein
MGWDATRAMSSATGSPEVKPHAMTGSAASIPDLLCHPAPPPIQKA